jgi:EmrB/QacA subfamily drug resistance transporter
LIPVTTNSAQQTTEDPQRWRALVVLTLALLVVTLGNGAVNIALPVLAKEYDADTADLQWVVTAYGLALAGLLFTGGALGDRFGRRHFFLLGLVLFLAGSFVAAFAPSLEVLIIARGLMGCAAALLLPAALAIVVHTFKGAERATAIAIWTSALGFAGSVAPVVTGWILARFPHGVIFVFGTPLTLFAMVGTLLWVRQSRDPDRLPVDQVGCVLSTLGIVGCVFAIIEAPREGWLAPTTLGAFLGGLLLLGLFAAWERTRDEPMIDMDTFRNPVARVGVIGTAFCFMSMQGAMFLTSQHLQTVAGHSPLVAGAINIPWGLAIVVASVSSGRIVNRWGSARVVGLSGFLIAAGMTTVGLTLAPDAPLWVLGTAMTVFHIGFGLAVAPLTAAIMSGVPTRRAGGGGALNSFARESGGALGVAVLGTVCATVYARQVEQTSDDLPGSTGASVKSSIGEALDALTALPSSHSVREAIASVSNAFDDGFTVALTLIVVGGLALSGAGTYYLPGRPHTAVPATSVVIATDDAAMAAPELALDTRDPRRSESNPAPRSHQSGPGRHRSN